MVFDPTFHEIEQEADELPDLSGDGIHVDPDDAEGEAEAEIGAGSVEADDLPPYGEE
jgi:hypothetical protein